jgi:hypothetical protein
MARDARRLYGQVVDNWVCMKVRYMKHHLHLGESLMRAVVPRFIPCLPISDRPRLHEVFFHPRGSDSARPTRDHRRHAADELPH